MKISAHVVFALNFRRYSKDEEVVYSFAIVIARLAVLITFNISHCEDETHFALFFSFHELE